MSEKPKITIEAEGVSAKPTGSIPKPAQVGDVNIAPTTTAAHDLATQGQRKINLIWESTQAIVAIVVTGATLYVASSLALKDNAEAAAFLLLSNAFFVVVQAYLIRTNHSRQGGVEPQRRGE